jgi:regulator of RNase E activity RraB
MNDHVTTTLPDSVPDEWDFYLTRIDDTAASFFLNLWYRSHAPLAGADTLYRCDLQILEPGPHGLGEAGDADRLLEIEEIIRERAGALDIHLVGRVRWNGMWLLRLFGPPGLTDRLREVVGSAIGKKRSRKFEVDATADPEWSHYFDFLCPDEERQQWMSDRSVVEVLMEQGDDTSVPRRVDHWAYFDTARQRDAFLRAVTQDGYELESAYEDETSDRRFCAQIYRIDVVDLEEIHDVVMSLIAHAQEHDGEYDGWETSVVRSR